MDNKKGFTLVELIVAMGLMTIIASLVMTMMINASKFFERQNAMVELQNQAQIVTNYITESFQEASGLRFRITDTSDNSGVYELYGIDDTDPLNIKVTGKGDMRILYYDGANTSLYMVSFDSTDPIPADTTYASIGYLLSDNITDFEVVYTPYDITDPTKETTTSIGPGGETITQAPDMGSRNPVPITVKFRMSYHGATAQFDVDATCRNHLQKIVIEDPSSTAEYDVLDR